MGARIAAHIANAGLPCYLLDIAPAELAPEEKHALSHRGRAFRALAAELAKLF